MRKILTHPPTRRRRRGREMTPEQSTEIKGRKVEQFYWAGKTVVYVDNHLVRGSYSETCEAVRKGVEPEFVRPSAK